MLEMLLGTFMFLLICYHVFGFMIIWIIEANTSTYERDNDKFTILFCILVPGLALVLLIAAILSTFITKEKNNAG